jgi:hypothetical protein
MTPEQHQQIVQLLTELVENQRISLARQRETGTQLVENQQTSLALVRESVKSTEDEWRRDRRERVIGVLVIMVSGVTVFALVLWLDKYLL